MNWSSDIFCGVKICDLLYKTALSLVRIYAQLLNPIYLLHYELGKDCFIISRTALTYKWKISFNQQQLLLYLNSSRGDYNYKWELEVYFYEIFYHYSSYHV